MAHGLRVGSNYSSLEGTYQNPGFSYFDSFSKGGGRAALQGAITEAD